MAQECTVEVFRQRYRSKWKLWCRECVGSQAVERCSPREAFEVLRRCFVLRPVLRTISAKSCCYSSTTTRRTLRPQSQRLSPHCLDAGTPQGFRWVRRKSVMCHATGAPRSIRATGTRNGRLHNCYGCRLTTTCQQRLAASRITDSWWTVSTSAYWTASHLCPRLPKQPIRGSPVSKSSVPVHQ
jgi:hypothetical protein